jgi:hypothetical protein
MGKMNEKMKDFLDYRKNSGIHIYIFKKKKIGK